MLYHSIVTETALELSFVIKIESMSALNNVGAT